MRFPVGTEHGVEGSTTGRETTRSEDGVKIVGIGNRNDTATTMTRRGLLKMFEEKNVAITSWFAVRYASSISRW